MRITETRLQEIIDLFADYPDLEPLPRPDAERVVELGHEVRRLRGIIVGAAAGEADALEQLSAEAAACRAERSSS
jgi:hypothetical protein